MTAFYIGVKIVEAWPSDKDGQSGYGVKYEDGYISWSPKDVFERSYMKLNDPSGSRITDLDIDDFFKIQDSCITKLGSKTTVVNGVLRNGFEIVESSSCVDPENYNEALGSSICIKRIKNRMWELLGFVLQWSKNGLK